jgi:hypothetical protein
MTPVESSDPDAMKHVAIALLVMIPLLAGCGREEEPSGLAISGFVDLLKDQGIDGTLDVVTPSNADIEYVANFVIAKYTSTRVISFFKFTDPERAEHNLQEALKNPKMSGQAINGSILMAATFYPPDESAVARIREMFLAYKFE